MGAYSSGSINVITGSQTVKGNSTNFTVYVSAGNYIRVSNDSAWYEVASVVDATELTLTGRYSNTSYQTSRSGEHVATANVATKNYSGILNHVPAIRNSVVINASIERFTDDGGGNLTGNASPAGTGTISYDDGAWSISLGTDLTATANVTASYYSGDSRTALEYQILTDYTSNYTIPEMSESDSGLPHIFTKAMRIIDNQLSNVATTSTASANVISASSRIKLGAHQYILFGGLNTQASIVAVATAVDASCKGSLYLSTKGALWITDSDTTASRFKKGGYFI